MIQQTSLEAYECIMENIGYCQKLIYDTITHNSGCSNHDIAFILGWEINRVTPRVKELRDKGYVSIKGDKIDPDTGMRVMTYEHNGGL